MPRLHRIIDDRAVSVLRQHLWRRAGHPDRTQPFRYEDFRELEPQHRRKVCAELTEFLKGTIRPELYALHPELHEIGEPSFLTVVQQYLAENAQIKTAIIVEQTNARKRADTSPPDQQDAWRRLHSELNRRARLRRDLDFTELSFAALDPDYKRAVCEFLYPDAEYATNKANQLGMSRAAFTAVCERFFAQHPAIRQAVLDDFAERQVVRYLCRTAKIPEMDEFEDIHLEALPLKDSQHVISCVAGILDGTLRPTGLADALGLSESDLKRAATRFLDAHPMMERYAKAAMAEPPATKFAFAPDATPDQMVRHYLWSRLELPGDPIDFADSKQFRQLDGHLQSRVTHEIYQLVRGDFSAAAATAFAGIDPARIHAAADQLRHKAQHLATEVGYVEQSQATLLKMEIQKVTGVHDIDDLNESIFDSLPDDVRDTVCDLLRLDRRQWTERGATPKFIELKRIAVNDFVKQHPWVTAELRQNALERNLGKYLTRTAGLRPETERLSDSNFPPLETGAERRLLQILADIEDSTAAAGAVAAELGSSVGDLRQAVDFLLDSHPPIKTRLKKFRAESAHGKPRGGGSPVKHAVEQFVERHGMTSSTAQQKAAREPSRTRWTVSIADPLFAKLDAPAQKWVTWFSRRIAIVNHPEKMLMKRVPGTAVYVGSVREAGTVLVAVVSVNARTKFGKDNNLEFAALYSRRGSDGRRDLIAGRRVVEYERAMDRVEV